MKKKKKIRRRAFISVDCITPNIATQQQVIRIQAILIDIAAETAENMEGKRSQKFAEKWFDEVSEAIREI
jgi:hypothetical protein